LRKIFDKNIIILDKEVYETTRCNGVSRPYTNIRRMMLVKKMIFTLGVDKPGR
jgi:hypothetical protein